MRTCRVRERWGRVRTCRVRERVGDGMGEGEDLRRVMVGDGVGDTDAGWGILRRKN